MTFQIELQNRNQHEYIVNVARLVEASGVVLAAHDIHPNSSLTIVIADDDFVRNLNHQFRGIDAPTDVLSFLADTPPVEIDDEPPYLGDLIIAYPYASSQAAREGHILGDSLALLVIHGTLHLLGYDHDTPATRAEMWAVQEAVLNTLGIPLHIVPALEAAPHDDPA